MKTTRVHIVLIEGQDAEEFLKENEESLGLMGVNRRFISMGILSADIDSSRMEELRKHSAVNAVEIDSVKNI